MTINIDKARDILFEAIDKVVAEGLLEKGWAHQLMDDVEDTLDQAERGVTAEEYGKAFGGLLDDILNSGFERTIH